MIPSLATPVLYAVALSICLSQVGVLPKQLKVEPHKQCCAIAQALQCSDTKDAHKIPLESLAERDHIIWSTIWSKQNMNRIFGEAVFQSTEGNQTS